MRSPREEEKLQQNKSFKGKHSIFPFFKKQKHPPWSRYTLICLILRLFSECSRPFFLCESEKAVLANPGNRCGIHNSPRAPKKVDSHM